jgi:outer membrane protein assembly factor BamB
MRVDPRSNYLFVAGCDNGDAYVFDADSGEEIMKYQLDDSDMDGVASGAMHGDSLYVNNARFWDYPGCLPDPDGCTEYWITKLNIYDLQ